MANVGCIVGNCKHEKNSQCFKRTISVHGRLSKKAKDTCCVDFKEGQGMSNTEFGSLNIEKFKTKIKCNALDCKHIKGSTCNKDSIEILGKNAVNDNGTHCKSFEC